MAPSARPQKLAAIRAQTMESMSRPRYGQAQRSARRKFFIGLKERIGTEPGASRDGPKFVAHWDKRDKSKPLTDKGDKVPFFSPLSLSPCLLVSLSPDLRAAHAPLG